MKRRLSIMLVGALLLGLLPLASLAADKLNVSQIKETTFNDQVAQAPTLTIINQGDAPVDITVVVYDELLKTALQTQQFHLPAGTEPLSVMGYVYKPLSHNGQINTYRYNITTAGGYKRTLYFAQIMHIDRATGTVYYTHTENPIFPRNTVTSFGPQFRIVKPDLTKEWYMFTPIDLTLQGRQTFELIGGNARVVGEVHVDVFGDQVTTTYTAFYEGQTQKVEVLSDYLNFFPAFSTITTVVPEELPSAFAFGVPFSISADLSGDSNVLMFVRNVQTFYRYPTPNTEMPRLQPNTAERSALRQRMLELMDPMEGLNLSNEHNYAQ